MTIDDLEEAASLLQVAVSTLQAAVPGQTGRTGAEFRYACGDLLAGAPALLQAGTVFDDVQACFDLAVTAGATLNGLLAIRTAMLAARPSGQPALWVAGTCYGLAIASEAKVLATTTFTSSDDALAALAVFGAGMDACQEWTADNHLPALYQALVALGAAVARDLTTRAAPLPRLTTYAFPRGTSSHVLAYRLYGDATRADELRDENKVNNPAFMPPSGKALSA